MKKALGIRSPIMRTLCESYTAARRSCLFSGGYTGYGDEVWCRRQPVAEDAWFR